MQQMNSGNSDYNDDDIDCENGDEEEGVEDDELAEEDINDEENDDKSEANSSSNDLSKKIKIEDQNRQTPPPPPPPSVFSKNFYKLINQNSLHQQQFQHYSLLNFQNMNNNSRKPSEEHSLSPNSNICNTQSKPESQRKPDPKENAKKVCVQVLVKEENEKTNSPSHAYSSTTSSLNSLNHLDALNAFNAAMSNGSKPSIDAHLLQHLVNSNPSLSSAFNQQFMSPAIAAAAAAYYNSASTNPVKQEQNEISPLSATNPAYQRSYLEALRFYKAAYESN